MELSRKPSSQEEQLLEQLIRKSGKNIPANWRDNLMVSSMNDGGMGSLYLFPNGKMVPGRKMGEQVSDFQFKDLDGVDVIASLNLDADGNLYELDIWKTDFGRLLGFPDV